MLIFLYGADTYRSRIKLKEIIERYKKIHKSGLSLKILEMDKKDFQDFDLELRSSSFFFEKKLIILKNAFANNDFKSKFLKNKKKYSNSQELVLFYEERTFPKNDSLFKFLTKYGKSQQFELLSGLKLKNWAKKEFEKYGAATEPQAIERLVEYIGNDLWRFSNEIKKLVAYKKNPASVPASVPASAPASAKATAGKQATAGKKAAADEEKIETEDVELLVKPKIETDIFKTIDALAEKNKSKALVLINKHLEKGDSPLYLLSMINFQFRNLLLVKTRHQYTNGAPITRINAVSKELGIYPFVARKATWQSQRFNLEELKKIYQKIFQADYNIKTGRVSPEVALDLLIAEI